MRRVLQYLAVAILSCTLLLSTQYYSDWSLSRHGLVILGDNVTVDGGYYFVVGSLVSGMSIISSQNTVVKDTSTRLFRIGGSTTKIDLKDNYIVRNNEDGTITLTPISAADNITLDGTFSITRYLDVPENRHSSTLIIK